MHRHIQQPGVCPDFHGHTPDCRSIHNPIHTSWAQTPSVHAQPQMEHAHHCMCTHSPRLEHTPDRHLQPHIYMHNSGLTALGHIQPWTDTHNPRQALTTLDRHSQIPVWHAQPQMGKQSKIHACTTPNRHAQPHICTHKPCTAFTTPDGHTEPRTGTQNSRRRCTVPYMHTQPQTGTPHGWAPLTPQGMCPQSIPPPCALEQWSEPCPGAVVQHNSQLLLAVTYEQGPF